MKRREALRRVPLLAVAPLVLLTACSTAPRQPLPGPDATTRNEWSGRLALQVLSDPAEFFSATFELTGHAEAGHLRLLSPFGQTVATARWQPGQAQLLQGDDVRTYPSMEALTEAVTGTALPVAALFQWLRGVNVTVAGWQADLSEQPAGRVRAERLSPSPVARLRLVFE